MHKPYVIPYDFDYAGIVNANYAVPPESLGILSVRERVYRGVCIPDAEMRTAIKQFLEQKHKIYSLYQQSELLDDRNLKQTLKYLDEFFTILEDESKLQGQILDTCR